TAGTATTDSGGNVFGVTGDMTTALEGPFIRMNDNCGAISETSTDGDLDLGTSGGTDCDIPPGHSAGDTHASRTGFFELNRIVEMALGQWPDPGAPANIWLQSQLTANMNIENTCGAFWNGTSVSFFRSNGGLCANTGEVAGAIDHEWGHGIDDNGTNGTISSPSEGIPDVYAALRLHNSCIGRGVFDGSLCNGYGDPCTPASGCTGVRDSDWANHTSGLPHDIDWVNGNPGCGIPHCQGAVYSEAIWDLFKRDLPTLYGYDNNTAHESANRLPFRGADNVTTWYVLTPPGGCGANSGYQQFLGADDDNGDLTDGTPHMQAIFSAYDRHQIACSTPVVQDSGCAGAPTQSPVVTAAPNNTGANLSWNSVPSATRYKIFRGDGEFQCDFGKAMVGETTSTSFADSGLQNGREYSYVV
ncbi:MAG: endopeptidase, partial [bacterium]|nr:endopeptidase [bacterium]